jgi:hypothetical protein
MAVAALRRGVPLDEPCERPPSPREAPGGSLSIPAAAAHTSTTACPTPRSLPRTAKHHDLVRRFLSMVGSRDTTPLPDWLDALSSSGLAPLAGLARALHEDQHAVPYNSGVNEGRITDVKLQKRVMGGRAGVRLLRHRVVLIAHLRRGASASTAASPASALSPANGSATDDGASNEPCLG